MRKNILVLTTSYPRYEKDIAAIFLKNLYNKIAEISDFKLIILASDSPLPCQQNLSNLGDKIIVKRYKYWIKRYQKLTYQYGVLSNLRKRPLLKFQVVPFVLALFVKAVIEIVKNRPVLIHAHWILPSGLVAVILGNIFRIPVMVTSHGSDIYGLKGKGLRLLSRLGCKGAYLINAVSETLKQEIRKINNYSPLREEIWVQSMGVDESKFYYIKNSRETLGFENRDKILLFVGRLSETKGLEYLIKSISRIGQNVSNLKLIAIGTGPQESGLKDLSYNLGIGERIIFKGQIDNDRLPLYYSAADLLVVPSIKSPIGQEGLGLVIVEGLFCRISIVTTSVGGIGDFRDYESIQFVKPANEEELSNAILESLKRPRPFLNPEVNKFTLSNVAANFCKQYERMLARLNLP